MEEEKKQETEPEPKPEKTVEEICREVVGKMNSGDPAIMEKIRRINEDGGEDE